MVELIDSFLDQILPLTKPFTTFSRGLDAGVVKTQVDTHPQHIQRLKHVSACVTVDHVLSRINYRAI